MTTTHDDRWKLPDGLEWSEYGSRRHPHVVSKESRQHQIWLESNGTLSGSRSLKDRPDAAHLEALLRARNGYVLPPGFEWRRDEDVNDYVFSTATGCAWVRADGTCYCSVQGPLRPMLRELVLMRAGRTEAPEPVVIDEVIGPSSVEAIDRALPVVEDAIRRNPGRVTIATGATCTDGGAAAFFGTWPGDETDAELQAALKDVRREPRGCPTPGACSAVRSYDDDTDFARRHAIDLYIKQLERRIEYLEEQNEDAIFRLVEAEGLGEAVDPLLGVAGR